jgi:hypothetical protein
MSKAELHGRKDDKAKGTELSGRSSRNGKNISFKNWTRKGELVSALWIIHHSCILNCHPSLHTSATRNIALCMASGGKILNLSATALIV